MSRCPVSLTFNIHGSLGLTIVRITLLINYGVYTFRNRLRTEYASFREFIFKSSLTFEELLLKTQNKWWYRVHLSGVILIHL